MSDQKDDDSRSKRIEALTGFVARFAPAIGEVREGYGAKVEDDAADEVLRARDAALVAAFRAIERLAGRDNA